MNHCKKKSLGIFAAAAIAACVPFQADGFAADKGAGFYAGPLSAVAEVVVEKSENSPENNPQHMDPAMQKSRNAAKKETKEQLAKYDKENPLTAAS